HRRPRRPPRPTLVPYTTLFRSLHDREVVADLDTADLVAGDVGLPRDGAHQVAGADAVASADAEEEAYECGRRGRSRSRTHHRGRSEEPSELQSRENLVCRLLLE